MRQIIDTGPVLAFFNERDQWHWWAKKKFSRLEPPFYTCEAVIAESVYQLLALRKDPDRVLKYVKEGYFRVEPTFVELENQNRIREIINKYHDQPADFADACLLSMYERHPDRSKIITVDSDFNIYRTRDGNTLQLISPHS